MSIPVNVRNVTSSNAQARQGPSKADTVTIDGLDYTRTEHALDILTDGTRQSAMVIYRKLKAAAVAGDVRVYRLHPRMHLYAVADVEQLRARLIEG